MLDEEVEVWDFYRLVAVRFPHEGDLTTYNRFVITGSRDDAPRDDAWICGLLLLLKKLDMMKKVLGICFSRRVKMTSPKKYSVKPNVGVIKPRGKYDFTDQFSYTAWLCSCG